MTGTPEGVAPVEPGDVMDCWIDRIRPHAESPSARRDRRSEFQSIMKSVAVLVPAASRKDSINLRLAKGDARLSASPRLR